MRRLRRLPDATADLDDIWLYIAQYDPTAAQRLINSIHNATLLLCRHPFIGPAKTEIAEEMRSFTVEHYRILYRVMPDTIDIVRVIHHKRDMSRLDLSP